MENLKENLLDYTVEELRDLINEYQKKLDKVSEPETEKAWIEFYEKKAGEKPSKEWIENYRKSVNDNKEKWSSIIGLCKRALKIKERENNPETEKNHKKFSEYTTEDWEKIDAQILQGIEEVKNRQTKGLGELLKKKIDLSTMATTRKRIAKIRQKYKSGEKTANQNSSEECPEEQQPE